MEKEYSLIDEPWLPCLDWDDQSVRVGLWELFERAHELRGLGCDTPLSQAALMRLLLAVVHRGIDGPRNKRTWRELWATGRFGGAVADYLERQRERFDLFSEAHPFMQTAGFATTTDPTPVNKLFHELASANNKTLFDHTLDDAPPALTPAEAALALVTYQSYAVGGGVSAGSNLYEKHPNVTHGPMIGGCVTLLQGENLFQTLMLNAVTYDPDATNLPIPRQLDEPDLPVWERNKPRPPQADVPSGYLDYLTWPSRHLRLLPEKVDGEWCVKRLYLSSGMSLASPVRDPLFAYKVNKDGQSFPVKLREERALWRDSSALFQFAGDTGLGDNRPGNIVQACDISNDPRVALEPAFCSVIGLANEKANPLMWRNETLPVSRQFLQDDTLPGYLEMALTWSEEIAAMLRDMLKRFAETLQTNHKRTPDTTSVSKMVRNIGGEARFWAGMEPLFHRYFRDLTEGKEPDPWLAKWRADVVWEAQNALELSTLNRLGNSAREMQARVEHIDRFGRMVHTKLKKTKEKSA